MATKPDTPTPVDPPLRSLGSDAFLTLTETWFSSQAYDIFPYYGLALDYIEETNTDVQAAAVASLLTELPLAGIGGSVVGVNDAEDGFEAVLIEEYSISTFSETLLDDESAEQMQVTLDLVPGTDIQEYSSNLDSFLGFATLPTSDGAEGQVLTTDGAGTLSFSDTSAHGIWEPEPTLTDGLLWSHDDDGELRNIAFTGMVAGYDYKMIAVDMSHNSSGRSVEVGLYVNAASEWVDVEVISLMSASNVLNGELMVSNPSFVTRTHVIKSDLCVVSDSSNGSSVSTPSSVSIFRSTGQKVTGVRLRVDTDEFDGGQVRLYRTPSLITS